MNYAGQIFEAHFKIYEGGMLEMTDDAPLEKSPGKASFKAPYSIAVESLAGDDWDAETLTWTPVDDGAPIESDGEFEDECDDLARWLSGGEDTGAIAQPPTLDEWRGVHEPKGFGAWWGRALTQLNRIAATTADAVNVGQDLRAALSPMIFQGLRQWIRDARDRLFSRPPVRRPVIDLREAHVGVLDDFSGMGWANSKREFECTLRLEGFTYDAIAYVDDRLPQRREGDREQGPGEPKEDDS